MIPVSRPYRSQGLAEKLSQFQEGNWFSPNGPISTNFKRALSEAYGSHVVLTNSGTSALEVAIRGLSMVYNRQGGRIIVPAYTCPDCAVAVLKSGFSPAFADVDRQRMTVTAETLEKSYTDYDDVVGVMLVHLWGMTPPLEVYAWARHRGLFILDDVAECLGSRPDGQDVLTLSDAAATSFRGDKPMPIGVGGAVLTRHDGVFGVANAVAGMNSPGGFNRLYSYAMPLSYEMSEVQAAVGLAQFAEYEERQRERWRVLAAIERAVTHCFRPGDIPWKLPVETKDARQAWLTCRGLGVETTPPHAPLYSLPFLRDHRSGAMRCGHVLKNTSWLYSHSLALPILPDMTEEEIDRVVRAWQAIAVADGP